MRLPTVSPVSTPSSRKLLVCSRLPFTWGRLPLLWKRADVLITTGGVSMGAFDVVKQALSELGTVEFVQVAMQPGKPQGFGHLGNRVPIFCLPGNPVSALVSFEVFVRPAIRKLLGKRNVQRATVQAVAPSYGAAKSASNRHAGWSAQGLPLDRRPFRGRPRHPLAPPAMRESDGDVALPRREEHRQEEQVHRGRVHQDE